MILILGFALLLLMITIGVLYYYKSVKLPEAVHVSTHIDNPGRVTLQEMQVEENHREEIRKLIPTYVSKDIYKAINDKQKRNQQVANDYFYLLDLAVACYFANKTDIQTNAMNNEKYIPVLVFSKYIIDYEFYIADVPADVMKNRFNEKYSKTPGIDDAMKFLNNLASMYKKDKRSYNFVIFEKFAKVVSQEATCPGAFYMQPAAVSAGALAVAQESIKLPSATTTTNTTTSITPQTPTAPTNTPVYTSTSGETAKVTNKPGLVQQESYLTVNSANRNNVVLQDFLKIYKLAIETCVTNKHDFFALYESRKTDAEFLNVGAFIPVLAYAKYIEDNQKHINNIDPVVLRNAINNLYPNFLRDQRFYVQGTHIQVFIILASNLYDSNSYEVNQLLLG